MKWWQKIKAQYGFDQPAHIRFWNMLKSYASFDFGSSFFKDKPVTQLLSGKIAGVFIFRRCGALC